MTLSGKVAPDSFFRWEELAISAKHPELVKPVPAQHAPAAKRLVITILDPLRRFINRRIDVLSCYRSKALNDAVKGSPTSQHVYAEAADIDPGTAEETEELFVAMLTGAIKVPCGQVIYYPLGGKAKANGGRFLHVALPSARYPKPSFHIHAPERGLRYQRVSSLSAFRSLVPSPRAAA